MSERLTLTVENPHGLHARPAARFVQAAARYRSNIVVRNLGNGKESDAKSIIQVMTAGINQGTEIELTADGEDAAEALSALQALIEQEAT